MVLFLQFDIHEEFGLPIEVGSHFCVFMSPNTNEIPDFEFLPSGAPLKPEFWSKREQHFRAFLFPAGLPLLPSGPDRYLEHQSLSFETASSTLGDWITVGGEPRWIQDPEEHPGPNGERFDLLCQIPEGFAFPKLESAPEQPDSFSARDYCLFLGNEVYFFVSAGISNYEGIWVTVQG